MEQDEQHIQQLQDQRRKEFREFIYLPLFYLIPDEIAIKRKLHNFPRDPNMVVYSEHWRSIYQGKHFQVMLLDTWGWMMWQSLGIRGGVDNYSKNDPFVQMVFAIPMWAWLVDEMNITTDLLASMAPGTEMPFLTMEQASYNCDQIAKRFWNHPFPTPHPRHNRQTQGRLKQMRADNLDISKTTHSYKWYLRHPCGYGWLTKWASPQIYWQAWHPVQKCRFLQWSKPHTTATKSPNGSGIIHS